MGLLGNHWSAVEPSAPVRHKIFVSYHHRRDQPYYDAFSAQFHDTHESIFDNSLERAVDSDNADYVHRRIVQTCIRNTSCSLILVGHSTWGRKHVDWEINSTLEMQHGLIGVQLPTAQRTSEGKVYVPGRLHDNIESGYAMWVTWEAITANVGALDTWIEAAKNVNRRLLRNDRAERLANGAGT